MNRNRQEFYRTVLTRKLEDLGSKVRARLAEGIKDFEDPETDIYDLCSQLYSKEQLFSLCERERQMLMSVKEALEKIENKVYGLCEECEEPINDKRLEALPWVKLCIDCQSKKEDNIAA